MPNARSRSSSRARLTRFLPTCRQEMDARGWSELDVLLITADAYVDHPAFGAAVIGRHLEARGHQVGVIAQPDLGRDEDWLRMGRPRLMVGVTAGNLDSMLAKFTALKKPRSEDPYAPGGRGGRRPKRASIVYANRCRQLFSGVPIVLGGIEASLRRLAHYDYWSDQVRRSVLLDAKADLLIYGMAERAVGEVVERLARGDSVGAIDDVRGTATVLGKGAWAELPRSAKVGAAGVVELPSFEQVSTEPHAFARMTRLAARESNPACARPLLQPHGSQAVLVHPPALPLSSDELDAVHELPFAREPHWSHAGGVPAFETVRHSVIAMRGCFGGCAFCSLTEHQGRRIQSRSADSIAREVEELARRRDFRGTVSDVGGPTANLYRMGCGRPDLEARCRRLSCVHPRICRHLDVDHGPLLDLLEGLRRQRGVEHVYLASGIRHDVALRSKRFVGALARHHTPGQLSLAPEHVCEPVLAQMRKPPIASFERFMEAFMGHSRRAGQDQHVVAYYLSGHPGTTLKHMVELAVYLKKRSIRPRQVQDFVPTPMTIATSMFHTGLDPFSETPVSVPRSLREKRLQRALLSYWDPAQHDDVREALREAGRADLIGSGPDCLVPPARGKGALPFRERGQGRRRSQGRGSRRRRR